MRSRTALILVGVAAVMTCSPAALQREFIARDESNVMPLELDVMTYTNR
jgi:hypothetical protein